MSNMVLNGVFCLEKPAEMTSFLCCAVMRGVLHQKKIGHAGTLDPMATGVLPILCGNATKAMDILPCGDKRYRAGFRLGVTSDTQDIWGTVTETGVTAFPSAALVEAALAPLRGDILQVPPMTSALKKDGVRLYELARKGVEIEREPRPVTVYELTLVSYDERTGEGVLSCFVSKGTYVRTLCHDLGQALGCGGVMTSLCRTMAAGYTLADCVSLEHAKAMSEAELRAHVKPTETVFASYPAVTVTAAQATRFQNGGALSLDRLQTAVTATVRVKAPDGAFLGLGTPKDGELNVSKLFPV